ncbi:MAG: methyltransferase [Kineosporiaceae bacterium]
MPLPEPVDAPRTDSALIDLLRADLAGYTVDAVHGVLGEVAHAALARELAAPARRACARVEDPVARLLELFVLGGAPTRRAIDAALPALGVDGARRLGLVVTAGEAADDVVRARVDLRPFAVEDGEQSASWWIASDPGELATGAPLRDDHVLGVGGASVTLAQSTVRRPAGRVLDLGTGCGVQALQASRHAAAVVGTDVSARALAYARFAAELNRTSVGADLSWRLGDLLEPVAGEAFDLVVSNPPFVITPRVEGVPAYEYRDAGREGDAVVRELVHQLPAHLAPGGVAQMLGNWEIRRGRDWRQGWREWLASAPWWSAGTGGLDVWVVQREVQDPAEYAQLWIRDGGAPGADAQQALIEAWLDDFDRRDVEGVGFGLITLRRPLTPRHGIVRLEDLRGTREQGLGEHVATVLDAVDWLAGRDDAGLVAAHLSVAGDVTEERHHLPGYADPQVILLRQGGGFGRVVPATTLVAAVVGACDGELSVGRIAGAVAHLAELPVDEVVSELVAPLRELVAAGMLVPATT